MSSRERPHMPLVPIKIPALERDAYVAALTAEERLARRIPPHESDDVLVVARSIVDAQSRPLWSIDEVRRLQLEHPVVVQDLANYTRLVDAGVRAEQARRN